MLPASIQLKLNKKEKSEPFWPRLLLDKALEKTNVKVDWDRYQDEDEAKGDFDTTDLMGGGGFGGFGGPGGMDFSGMGAGGGMDFGDDDDDEEEGDLPDLEPTNGGSASTAGQQHGTGTKPADDESDAMPELE